MTALRAELVSPDPAPQEAPLVDRVVVTWLDVNHADACAAAAAREPGTTTQQADFAQRRQERALRRHLAAVAALASTRKLLGRVKPRGERDRPVEPAGASAASGAARPA